MAVQYMREETWSMSKTVTHAFWRWRVAGAAFAVVAVAVAVGLGVGLISRSAERTEAFADSWKTPDAPLHLVEPGMSYPPMKITPRPEIGGRSPLEFAIKHMEALGADRVRFDGAWGATLWIDRQLNYGGFLLVEESVLRLRMTQAFLLRLTQKIESLWTKQASALVALAFDEPSTRSAVVSVRRVTLPCSGTPRLSHVYRRDMWRHGC